MLVLEKDKAWHQDASARISERIRGSIMELGRWWVIRLVGTCADGASLYHHGHKLRLQKGVIQSPFKIPPTTGDPLRSLFQTHEHFRKTLHIWTITGETVLWPVLEWRQFPVLRMLWCWYVVAQSKHIRGQECFSVPFIGLWWRTESHVWLLRTVLVWILCHKRRICGNWHPLTPWGCGNWYNPCGKQFGMSIENHPNTHIPWLTSLLGVYPKKIIAKKEKVIHEGVMGALFSKDENQQMYKPQVGKIFQ